MWGELFPSGNPFSTDTIIFLDIMRIVLVVVSLGVAAFCLPIARHVRNSRKFGCFSLAGYSVFAALFCVTRIGQPVVSPSLILVIAGAAFGYTYCYRVSKEIKSGKYKVGGKYYELHND